MSAQIPLLLFAKAPVAGKVKTRLQPQCSAEQSADIAKILLQETLRKATQNWRGKVYLCVWPDQQNDFLQSMADRYTVELITQDSGDLGDKMHLAFERTGYPAAIIGCDAPHIAPSTFVQAYESLSRGQNVIAAAEDGGYYFIGLAQPAAGLFGDMSWGEDRVFLETMQRAQQQAKEFVQLKTLNDIDAWQDVLSAVNELPELQAYLQQQNLI
jgi:rSAM/selenodomain-associated transferase 1